MTNAQINIAIAKLCGMEVLSDGIRDDLTRCNWQGDITASGKLLKEIPNYCEDLNAMHQAEDQCLHGMVFNTYALILQDIIGSLFGIRATARERAEALLKALEKWDVKHNASEPYEL